MYVSVWSIYGLEVSFLLFDAQFFFFFFGTLVVMMIILCVKTLLGEMKPIFCGNFDFEARQSDLERLFRKYGRVTRVDMKSGNVLSSYHVCLLFSFCWLIIVFLLCFLGRIFFSLTLASFCG